MTVGGDEFARQAAEFFRLQGDQRSVGFDAGRNQLVLGDAGGPVSFVYLGHAQKEHLAAPNAPEKEKVLARRLWSSVRRSTHVAPEVLFRSVLPRVRDRAWFSAVRRQAELELGADEEAIRQVTLPHGELNTDLAVHLTFELPTSVMEIGPDRLAQWGQTFDGLLDIARKNLRERSKLLFEEPQPGVYVSPYRDAFDASRMMLPELFTSLPVKGLPVVIAPTHDIVLVAGDQDANGLATIGTWAEEALLEPRTHSAIAFRLHDGRWEPWLPELNHPAYAKLKLLSLQTVASAYARQKEVLDALLAANQHQLLVANLRAFRTQRGELFTSSAWTEGVEALLPQTDRIDFVRLAPGGDGSSGEVWSTSWDIARTTLGEQMQPTGDVPERWRVSGFPSAAQLTQMADAGKLQDA